MKCLSLFSGIGGFDLALQRKGHEIVGACEIDKYARQIYTKRFPGVRIYEDATKLNPEELPDFDLLVGGFPCQAFSLAGRRLGFEESRGTLFYEIARIAKQKRPSILLLENVKGLLYHDKGRTFETIIKTFDELGYDIEWQVINSKYFVPQSRERIFIIGHLRGQPRREIFPIGNIGQVNGRENGESNAERIGMENSFSYTIDANYYKGPDGKRTMIYVSQTNQNMKQRIQVRDNTWTLTNARDFLIQDKGKVRRFTPLECERLQGFPDGWTEGLSDTQRYKCLGNAVTVPVIEYILDHIRGKR